MDPIESWASMSEENIDSGVFEEHSGVVEEHSGVFEEHSGVVEEHFGIVEEHSSVIEEDPREEAGVIGFSQGSGDGVASQYSRGRGRGRGRGNNIGYRGRGSFISRGPFIPRDQSIPRGPFIPRGPSNRGRGRGFISGNIRSCLHVADVSAGVEESGAHVPTEWHRKPDAPKGIIPVINAVMKHLRVADSMLSFNSIIEAQAIIPKEALLEGLMSLHEANIRPRLRSAFRYGEFSPDARELFFQAMQLIRSIPEEEFLISVRNNKGLHETRDYLLTMVATVCFTCGLMTPSMNRCVETTGLVNLGNKFHSLALIRDIYFMIEQFGCKLIAVPSGINLEELPRIEAFIIKRAPNVALGSWPDNMFQVIIAS